jgi:hypothetical protein
MRIFNWLRTHPAIALFGFAVTVYHSNLRPISAADSIPAAVMTQSILGGHGVTLDWIAPAVLANPAYAYCMVERHGHLYSLYPVATGLIAFPFYAVPVAAFGIEHRDPAFQLGFARLWEKVAAVFLAAASAGVFLMLLLRLTTFRWALALSLVFAIGTNIWATNSQALWQQTPGVLFLSACLYCLLRWWDGRHWNWIAAAGTCAAVAAAIRPSNGIFCLAVIAALLLARAWKAAAIFCLPGAVVLVPLLAYNLSVFNGIRGGYTMAFSGSFSAGFVGLLFSPARGLLVYTPVAIFALWGLRPSGARERFLATICGGYVAASILFLSFWPAWPGGFCWGPRLLVECLPGLIVLMSLGLPRWQTSTAARAAFLVLALWGFFTQAVGVYCYPKGEWDSRPAPFDDSRLWDWSDSPIQRSLKGGFYWEPYAMAWTRITQGPMPLVELKRRSGIK